MHPKGILPPIVKVLWIVVILYSIVLVGNMIYDIKTETANNALIYRDVETNLMIRFPIFKDEHGKHYISYPKDWETFRNDAIEHGGKYSNSEFEFDNVCLEGLESISHIKHHSDPSMNIAIFKIYDKTMFIKYRIKDHKNYSNSMEFQ